MSDMMCLQPQACFFPILDLTLGPSEDNNWQAVEVPIHNISPLTLLCKEHEVSPLTVFKLAWALVLQCYAGSNSPTFGHLTLSASESNGNLESPCALGYIRSCHVELEEAGSVIEVLRAIQAMPLENESTRLFPSSDNKSKRSALYNTALRFQEVGSARNFNSMLNCGNVKTVPEDHVSMERDETKNIRTNEEPRLKYYST